jgi:hypothetical protein
MALPFSNAGSWQSGLMRRTYNPVKRVQARSEGPNPSGPANMLTSQHEGRKTEI